MTGKLLTPEQVASRLAISPRSIREWLRSGRLKGVKAGRLWRIRDYDVEDFLKHGSENRAGGTPPDDPFLQVIGCLGGEPLSSREMDEGLYGEEIRQ